MHISEPLGVPGAPLEMLEAWTASAQPQGRLILLTDTQGHRISARYAAMLVSGQGEDTRVLLSAPAFGPQFGEAGVQALAQLAHWANSHGLAVRETVVSRPEFNRVLAQPEAHTIAPLLAASNPSDASIYTTSPEQQTD